MKILIQYIITRHIVTDYTRMIRQQLLKAVKVMEKVVQQPSNPLNPHVLRFYIPLCPRYYDRFNYRDFRNTIVSETAKFVKNEDTQLEIARKLAEVERCDGWKIYFHIKVGELTYGHDTIHIIPGLAVRSVIAGLILGGTVGGLPVAFGMLYAFGDFLYLAVASDNTDKYLNAELGKHFERLIYQKSQEITSREILEYIKYKTAESK